MDDVISVWKEVPELTADESLYSDSLTSEKTGGHSSVQSLVIADGGILTRHQRCFGLCKQQTDCNHTTFLSLK